MDKLPTEAEQAISRARVRLIALQWLAVVSDLALGIGLLLIPAATPGLEPGAAMLLRGLGAGLLLLGLATVFETLLRARRFQRVASCLLNKPQQVLDVHHEVSTVHIFTLHITLQHPRDPAAHLAQAARQIIEARF